MRIAPILLVAVAAVGCESNTPAPPAQKLTAHQRDSVDRAHHEAVSKSGIPGASAIGKAQKAADNESKRINALDTIH